MLVLIATLITACSAADIKGANLGGFLLIEEWMFSNVCDILFDSSYFIHPIIGHVRQGR
jgi:hypothetical protein